MPKYACQTRLTIARAVVGLSRDVNQRASASRPSPAFWGILVALPVGKVIGISLGGWLGSFTRPKGERGRISLLGMVTMECAETNPPLADAAARAFDEWERSLASLIQEAASERGVEADATALARATADAKAAEDARLAAEQKKQAEQQRADAAERARAAAEKEAAEKAAAAKAKGPNYLFDELRERIARGPIEFKVLVQLAGAGDVVDDATIHWPPDRPLHELGRIVLTEPVANDAAEQKHIIFDPIPRVDGIEPSADPLLELRAAVYLISGRRRRAAGK